MSERRRHRQRQRVGRASFFRRQWKVKWFITQAASIQLMAIMQHSTQMDFSFLSPPIHFSYYIAFFGSLCSKFVTIKFVCFFLSTSETRTRMLVIISISTIHCDFCSVNRPLIFFSLNTFYFVRKEIITCNIFMGPGKIGGVCEVFFSYFGDWSWSNSWSRECVQALWRTKARRKVNMKTDKRFTSTSHEKI